MFIDLSWVVYENYIYREPTELNPKAVDQRQAWADLIADFESNFMIGSDIVAKFDRYSTEINKYDPLFRVLRERQDGDRIASRVAHDNFVQLMESLRDKRGGAGLVLDSSYLYPEERYTGVRRTVPE